jgi:tetratricopeptide (TPR) repeat protein
VELNPEEKEARHRIGAIHIQRGEWARAREELERAVDQDARDHEAWNALGLVAFHEGRDQPAREYYLRAIDIDGEYGKAWCNLGNLFARLGDEKAAEEAYLQAARRDGQDPDVWYNLGEFYFRRNHPETERCLLKTIELNRADLEAWELLRQWYTRRPNYPVWKTALRVLLRKRPDDLALLRELAYVDERLGHHEEAIGTLRHLLSLDPEDEESRLLLAELYDGLGKPVEAFAHLERLSTTGERVIDLAIRLGQRLLHQNHAPQAETCFLKRVAHRPADADAWRFLGELALRRDQLELAFERHTRAVGLNRNDVALWRPLAEKFLAQGDPARALACLGHLDDHLRYTPELWREFFALHRAAGQGEAFLARLEALMGEGWVPNRRWVDLAELYGELGLRAKTEACLARLEREDAPDSASDLAMARYHLERRDAAKALEYLERIRDSAAGIARYWLLRAEAHYLLGAYGEARASYECGLKLDDADFRAWFNLGNIHFRDGRHHEARHAFLKAVERDPKQAKAWYNLGCVEDELGLEAWRGFRQANALDPRFAPAWNALGVLHFRAAEDKAARRCFLRCLGSNRESVLGWGNLAALYRRMGRLADAEHCERQVIRLGGKPPQGDAQRVRLFFDREPHGR